MAPTVGDNLVPATGAHGPVGSTGKRDSAIAFLQRCMAHKPDFPAISQHIAEINQKSGLRNSSGTSELASIVPKDYALTTKQGQKRGRHVGGQGAGWHWHLPRCCHGSAYQSAGHRRFRGPVERSGH
jgi:hypothetical protein